MKDIVRDIFINAPKEKVWKSMLEDKTYREWTSAFHEGSFAESDWQEGSKIMFIDDSRSGMLGFIKEMKPYDTISFEFTGLMMEGKEDTESEWAKKYAGLIEKYTFTDQDGGTMLHIEAGAEDDMLEEMETGWDQGLAKLKEIAEAH